MARPDDPHAPAVLVAFAARTDLPHPTLREEDVARSLIDTYVKHPPHLLDPQTSEAGWERAVELVDDIEGLNNRGLSFEIGVMLPFGTLPASWDHPDPYDIDRARSILPPPESQRHRREWPGSRGGGPRFHERIPLARRQWQVNAPGRWQDGGAASGGGRTPRGRSHASDAGTLPA